MIPIPFAINKRFTKKEIAKIVAQGIKDFVKPENYSGIIELLLLVCREDPEVVPKLKMMKKIIEVVLNEVEAEQKQ